MKTSSHTSSSKGFTLIELLVVIAIIAVLASAGFAGGAAIMNKARKTSAQATAVSIAQAVDNFYTEYSALPAMSDSPSETTPLVTSSSGSGIGILKILSGEDLNSQNPRKIRFFSGKEAKSKRDGVVYSGSSIDALLDPWGQPFYIMMDYTYDEELSVKPGISGTDATLRGRRVAVYSSGVVKSLDATKNTLVKTW